MVKDTSNHSSLFLLLFSVNIFSFFDASPGFSPYFCFASNTGSSSSGDVFIPLVPSQACSSAQSTHLPCISQGQTAPQILQPIQPMPIFGLQPDQISANSFVIAIGITPPPGLCLSDETPPPGTTLPEEQRRVTQQRVKKLVNRCMAKLPKTALAEEEVVQKFSELAPNKEEAQVIEPEESESQTESEDSRTKSRKPSKQEEGKSKKSTCSDSAIDKYKAIEKRCIDEGFRLCNGIVGANSSMPSSEEGREVKVLLASGKTMKGVLIDQTLYFRSAIPRREAEGEYGFSIPNFIPGREILPQKFGSTTIFLAFEDGSKVVPEYFDIVTAAFYSIFHSILLQVEPKLSEGGKIIYREILKQVGKKHLLDEAFEKASRTGELEELQELMYWSFDCPIQPYDDDGCISDEYLKPSISGLVDERELSYILHFTPSYFKRKIEKAVASSLNLTAEEKEDLLSLKDVPLIKPILGGLNDLDENGGLIRGFTRKNFIYILLQQSELLLNQYKENRLFRDESEFLFAKTITGEFFYRNLIDCAFIKKFINYLAAKGYKEVKDRNGGNPLPFEKDIEPIEGPISFEKALESVRVGSNEIYALIPMREWAAKNPDYKKSLVYRYLCFHLMDFCCTYPEMEKGDVFNKKGLGKFYEEVKPITRRLKKTITDGRSAPNSKWKRAQAVFMLYLSAKLAKLLELDD